MNARDSCPCPVWQRADPRIASLAQAPQQAFVKDQALSSRCASALGAHQGKGTGAQAKWAGWLAASSTQPSPSARQCSYAHELCRTTRRTHERGACSRCWDVGQARRAEQPHVLDQWHAYVARPPATSHRGPCHAHARPMPARPHACMHMRART